MIFANLILTITIILIAIKLSFVFFKLFYKLMKVLYFIYRVLDGDFLEFKNDKSNDELLNKKEQITKVI